MKTYQEIADEAVALLDQNQGWIQRYSKYYDDISGKKYVDAVCKCFRAKRPLVKYLSIGMVKDAANIVTIDLRVMGHSVANIVVTLDSELKNRIENDGEKVPSKEVQKYAKVFFKERGLKKVAECVTKPNTFNEQTKHLYEKQTKEGWNWQDEALTTFRSLIDDDSQFTIASEHTVETLLLDELSKTSRDGKYIPGIQPCRICGQYYQFVTPLKASEAKDDKLSYVIDKDGNDRVGGGIDILARIRMNTDIGFKSELCVIELKDKYEKAEPPEKAIKQAIAYAAFIIKLVRCDEAQGRCWYKHFGINNPIGDKPITINAVVAMPYPDDDPKKICNITPSFVREEVKVGNDIIKLHCIFFTKAALQNPYEKDGFKTSLPVKTAENSL